MLIGWATGHSTVFISEKIILHQSDSGALANIESALEMQNISIPFETEHKISEKIDPPLLIVPSESAKNRYSNQYKNIDKYKQSVEFSSILVLMQNYVKVLMLVCFLSLLYIIYIYRRRLWNIFGFGNSTMELKRYR